jgi:hypothetical protein
MLIPIADRIAAELYRNRNSQFIHRHYNPDYPVLNFLENLVIEEVEKDHPYEKAAATKS